MLYVYTSMFVENMEDHKRYYIDPKILESNFVEFCADAIDYLQASRLGGMAGWVGVSNYVKHIFYA